MININDAEVLREMYQRFKPVGSGPLSTMRVITQLIEAIAEEKGIELEPVTRQLIEFEETCGLVTVAKVKLEGKYVGEIKRNGDGFAYYPRGQHYHGEVFSTVEEVKQSVKGD